MTDAVIEPSATGQTATGESAAGARGTARFAAVFAVVTAGIAMVNLDRLRKGVYVDTLPVCKSDALGGSGPAATRKTSRTSTER